MKNVHPAIAALAIIGGLVILGMVLRIAFTLLPLLILLAIGVFVYVVVQNATSKGR